MSKKFKNLVKIINLFNNRPNHLSKYLLDNDFLSDNFIKKLSYSNINIADDIIFEDISQLNEYYNSIFDDMIKEKTIDEISIDLTNKLDNFLKEEKYEEAINVRDYMIRNNIPRSKL